MDVDGYIERSKRWPEELAALRPLLLDAGLEESVKWGKPCYAVPGGGNVAILQEFKEHLALMFFKGALLDDPDGVLEEQGPNSRSARRISFTSMADVDARTPTVRRYLAAAIANEQAGLEVERTDEREPLAEELIDRIEGDEAFRTGWESLTPGRQRAYNLDIAAAKQSATRTRRVEKHAPAITAGRGLRDR